MLHKEFYSSESVVYWLRYRALCTCTSLLQKRRQVLGLRLKRLYIGAYRSKFKWWYILMCIIYISLQYIYGSHIYMVSIYIYEFHIYMNFYIYAFHIYMNFVYIWHLWVFMIHICIYMYIYIYIYPICLSCRRSHDNIFKKWPKWSGTCTNLITNIVLGVIYIYIYIYIYILHTFHPGELPLLPP